KEKEVELKSLDLLFAISVCFLSVSDTAGIRPCAPMRHGTSRHGITRGGGAATAAVDGRRLLRLTRSMRAGLFPALLLGLRPVRDRLELALGDALAHGGGRRHAALDSLDQL